MGELWFWLVAAMLVGYTVLDGFDLGVGIVHLFVARTDEERRIVLGSIGPFWDGNEVWLLAAGGTLFLAFPALYAASFSGFYLPLMVVLWLLMLRGIAIEFRSHLDDPLWRPFWDLIFAAASSLLAIFFGAALGNVVRGVPLDKQGEFFLPLWTDFNLTGPVGILDWYTISIALLAFVTLAMHGALWVAYKSEAAVQGRARMAARIAWIGTAGLTLIATYSTAAVQPYIWLNLKTHPAGFVFPAGAVAGLALVPLFSRRSKTLAAFLASSAYIVGMLASTAFGIFPYLLPSNEDLSLALSVKNASAQPYGLQVGLFWWIPGMMLASAYFVFLYSRFSGKARAGHGE